MTTRFSTDGQPRISRRGALLGMAAGLAAVGLGTAPALATPATARRAAGYPPIDFQAANPANFEESERPSTYPIEYVVVHVTQETYAETIRIFRDPSRKVSAHYVVRSADGHLAECVSEKNVAYHAGNYDYNTRSIGIEHEGYVDQPSYFTDELYATSAQLTRAICDKYGIPIDREHIIGHSEVPGATHTDPGRYWDWARYLDAVNSAG